MQRDPPGCLPPSNFSPPRSRVDPSALSLKPSQRTTRDPRRRDSPTKPPCREIPKPPSRYESCQQTWPGGKSVSHLGFSTAAWPRVVLHHPGRCPPSARLPRHPSSRIRVATSRASWLTAAIICRALFVKNLRCVAITDVVVVLVGLAVVFNCLRSTRRTTC